jgi:hypothetical protein
MSERPHCLWESPDGQTAVYLAFDVVDSINVAIQDAASSVPIRGAEIGGLLLGKAEKRSRLTVWVDRVEFLPCHYGRGPSFHPDDEDLPDLSRPEIAGFFRTHTRKDLFLGPDDQALISRHFNRPEQIALLVKPFQTRANVGGFFVRKDGVINGASSPKEFPFHRRELGGGEPVLRAPASPVTTGRRRDEEDYTGSALPPVESPNRSTLRRAVLAFVALVAAASVTYLLFERTKPISPVARRPPATGSPLRLSAFEGDHNMTLTWDTQSTAVTSAARGVVEIQEGTFEKKLEIGADQLRAGKIIYSRPVTISDSVAFLLRVYPQTGSPIAESLQIVSNQAAGTGRPAELPIARVPPAVPSKVTEPLVPKPPTATQPIPSVASVSRTEEKVDSPPPEQPKTETVRTETPKVDAPKTDPTPPVLVRPAPRRIP